MSSLSSADLLAAVSERIAEAFNRSQVTQTLALDISNAFERVWHAGLLQTQTLWNIRSGIWPYFIFSE